ncbi:TRAP transporter small permease [Roseomonas sp. HF4]|uniref:TRAP transporter small permease n=1 Tax=Roseomonas sp. HF4 TaxID=2562313 RepID=UPI0010BFC97A|nr:TRAP transporter small permease subunit [Roseomonas sp. HF4]
MPPTSPRGLVRKAADIYARALSVLLAVSVLILVFPVAMQVFSRQTDLLPHYIWTEEMARFLLVWTIMIGAIVGQRDGIHFIVDLWPELTGRPKAAMGIVSGLFGLLFGAVFLWFGIEFVDFAWFRISELAELPLWLIHLAWPVLGFSWILFAGERLVDDMRVLMRGEQG